MSILLLSPLLTLSAALTERQPRIKAYRKTPYIW
jgi:hypothetical protein